MKKEEEKKIEKKIKKNTKYIKSGPKTRSTRYIDAKSIFSWSNYNPGPEWGEKVADILLEWSKDETKVSFNAFYIWFGIPLQSYHDMLKQHPILKSTHEFVKLRFADRRERGALDRSMDARTVAHSLHKYDSVWKEIHDEDKEFRKQLNDKHNANRPTEITVVMDNYDDEEKGHEPVDMA